MHVCLATPGLAPGGAQRLVCEELKHFSEFGAEVSVVTPFVDEEYFAEMDIPEAIEVVVCSADGSRGSFLVRTRRIRHAIRELSPDVVCSHYRDEEVYLTRKTTDLDFEFTVQLNGTALWFSDNYRVVPHRRKKQYPELMDAVPGHREFERDLDPSVGQRLKAELGEYLRTRALRSAEAVFVLSGRVRAEVSALYGVDSTIVRAGVPDSWQTRAERTPTVDIGDGNRVVLSVSRLEERKRIGLLISAFAMAESLHDDTCLVIGGTGEEEQALKRRVRRLDLEEHVVFEGYIPEKKLLKYYKSADVFACPGYMTYGLAPLEAYSTGAKIALSTDAYVRELLEEKTGVETARPDATAWSEMLATLLDEPAMEPNAEIIPRWNDFTEQKYDVFTQLSS